MSRILHFTPAQLLAHRARNLVDYARRPYEPPSLKERLDTEHAKLGLPAPDPDLYHQHVLPGAKRAITHRELHQHHADGLTAHQILELVNARESTRNMQRQLEFQAWRAGPYQQRIREVLAKARAKSEIDAQFERKWPTHWAQLKDEQ